MNQKMHKAITVIQFKLEGKLLMRRKEFGIWRIRGLLDEIDYRKGTVRLGYQTYPMLDYTLPLTRRIPMSLPERSRRLWIVWFLLL